MLFSFKGFFVLKNEGFHPVRVYVIIRKLREEGLKGQKPSDTYHNDTEIYSSKEDMNHVRSFK